jgi:hypothetical protein
LTRKKSSARRDGIRIIKTTDVLVKAHLGENEEEGLSLFF